MHVSIRHKFDELCKCGFFLTSTLSALRLCNCILRIWCVTKFCTISVCRTCPWSSMAMWSYRNLKWAKGVIYFHLLHLGVDKTLSWDGVWWVDPRFTIRSELNLRKAQNCAESMFKNSASISADAIGLGEPAAATSNWADWSLCSCSLEYYNKYLQHPPTAVSTAIELLVNTAYRFTGQNPTHGNGNMVMILVDAMFLQARSRNRGCVQNWTVFDASFGVKVPSQCQKHWNLSCSF